MTAEAISKFVMPGKLDPASKPGAGIQGTHENDTSQPQRLFIPLRRHGEL